MNADVHGHHYTFKVDRVGDLAPFMTLKVMSFRRHDEDGKDVPPAIEDGTVTFYIPEGKERWFLRELEKVVAQLRVHLQAFEEGDAELQTGVHTS